MHSWNGQQFMQSKTRRLHGNIHVLLLTVIAGMRAFARVRVDSEFILPFWGIVVQTELLFAFVSICIVYWV